MSPFKTPKLNLLYFFYIVKWSGAQGKNVGEWEKMRDWKKVGACKTERGDEENENRGWLRKNRKKKNFYF